MLNGPVLLLVLKVAVVAVTLLLLASLAALARGNYRLHGRINVVFFVLTLAAVLGLELVVRVIDPTVFDYFDEVQRRWLRIHLCFSLPAAAVLPAMLYTGWKRRRDFHLFLAGAFSVLWLGTLVTGIFFL